MSKQEPERSDEELLTRVANGMIYLLSPAELEKWAELEETIAEAQAQRTKLRETVRDRKLTDYQDESRRDPKEEAILQEFSKEERAFVQAAYPEDLRLYGELLKWGSSGAGAGRFDQPGRGTLSGRWVCDSSSFELEKTHIPKSQ